MKITRWASMAAMMAAVGLSACATDGPGYVDPGLSPAYGMARLRAGFRDDPHRVELTAGGTESAFGLAQGCAGYIAAAPDYRIQYQAGRQPLTIAASSRTDTTLIVNLPDGSWICDDDSGGQNDPRITLTRPQSGQYDIWVGVYGGGTAPATLYISER